MLLPDVIFYSSAPDPAGGSLQRSPDPLAGFRGLLLRGRGKGRGWERKGKGQGCEGGGIVGGRERREREGREKGKGRKGEGRGGKYRHFFLYTLSTKGKHIVVYDFDFQDTSIHVIVIVRN